MPLTDLLGLLLVRLLLACADALEHWLRAQLLGEDDAADDVTIGAEQLRHAADRVRTRIGHPAAKKALEEDPGG